MGLIYQKLVRPTLFLFDPETVHGGVTFLGEVLGNLPFSPKIYPQLTQTISGINFPGPVGLAAGFDYKAHLTQILPALGFGFGTIGTITNLSSQGNSRPRLGRLPQSKSLMVNKGFRNPGAAKIITKLSALNFSIPIGVSIGDRLANMAGIVSAFEKFEKSNVKHSYYELNISCPNLQTKKDFYSPKTLTALLKAVDALKISRPIFIKMPISKTDTEIRKLFDVISNYSPAGVILGNLQKDRQFLHPNEVNKFSVGNFSGKPTWERSNELISLAHKNFKQRFVIIGCGGVFSAYDAYEKICLGASLVQLITGLVYMGPHLVSEINYGLLGFLKRDGYKNISQAVGSRLRFRQ